MLTGKGAQFRSLAVPGFPPVRAARCSNDRLNRKRRGRKNLGVHRNCSPAQNYRGEFGTSQPHTLNLEPGAWRQGSAGEGRRDLASGIHHSVLPDSWGLSANDKGWYPDECDE